MHKDMCDLCKKQTKSNSQQPHQQLALISELPFSKVYCCNCCHSFWMSEDGHMEMVFHSAEIEQYA